MGEAIIGLIGVAIGVLASVFVQSRIADAQRRDRYFHRRLDKLEEITVTLIAARRGLGQLTREITENTIKPPFTKLDYLPSPNEMDRLRSLAKLYAPSVLDDMQAITDCNVELYHVLKRLGSKEIEREAMVREIRAVHGKVEAIVDKATDRTAELARS